MRFQRLPGYFISCFLLIAATVQAQEPFEINGTIPLTRGKLYLSYIETGKLKRDSSELNGTSFRFTGNIKEPGYATLLLKPEGQARTRSVDFWVEPGKLTMTCDSTLEQTIIYGGPTNDDQKAYKQWLAPVNLKYKPTLDSLFRTRNQDTVKMIRERLAPYFHELYLAETSFFRAHGDSYVAGINLYVQMARMSVDTIEQYYSLLSPRIQNSATGVTIKTKIDNLRAVITLPARDFTRVNLLTGKNLSLSQYRGKYVILDFWASWCVPCRKEHPDMLQFYARYKREQLEFIGVSDDHETDKWKQAVKKDKLPWPQIRTDLPTAQPNEPTAIDTHYEVSVLPTIFLIDPKGMVVGRYANFEAAKPVLERLLAGK